MPNYFFTSKNGIKQGPFAAEELQSLIDRGFITSTTLLETDNRTHRTCRTDSRLKFRSTERRFSLRFDCFVVNRFCISGFAASYNQFVGLPNRLCHLLHCGSFMGNHNDICGDFFTHPRSTCCDSDSRAVIIDLFSNPLSS